MAIGTYSGVVKVFGAPGVEFYGNHPVTSGNTNDNCIQCLEWLNGNGRLLSVSISNCLSLWEPKGTILIPIKSCLLDSKTRKISAVCASQEKNIFWVATESGSIIEFDCESFIDTNVILTTESILDR